MARPDKVAVVEDVARQLADAPATVLTEYRGLSVPQMQQLRAALREAGARYRIAKNTLIRRAVDNAGMSVPTEVLTGPTGVTFAGDDLAAAAKALRRFAREHPALVIKGALLEGEFLDADQADALADLPSRDELLAEILGMFETLLASPVTLADALPQELVGLMTALEDSKPAE